MSKNKKIYLIDATAFCYRAFYAVKADLSTSFGQKTNAIYGFVNMLQKILKSKDIEYLGVCFDVSRETFRTKKFSDYKIQRPPMPEELSSQISLIKDVVRAWGISIFEKQGFEADDIIASLARQARDKGFEVEIVSSDKDMLQLVDTGILVYSPYKDEGTTYDKDKVIERYGVAPDKITDIIALAGDDVDNIPGAKGIGEKSAVELIKEFGSVDNLLKNKDKISSKKLHDAVANNIENIKLSKELACLDQDPGIVFLLQDLKIAEPNYNELLRLFKYLEFKKFLKDFSQRSGQQDSDSAIGDISDSQLPKIAGQDLIFYIDSQEDFVFKNAADCFRVKDIGKNLAAVLSDPTINKVSHDLKRAKVLLKNKGVALNGIYFDVMIAAYLLNPSKSGYALSDLAWDYLQEASIGESSGVALNVISRVMPILEKQLAEKSLNDLFARIEMPLVDVLAEMELDGIKLDTKLLSGLSKQLEKRLIKLIEEIYALSGSEFNINSPKQLREILFVHLKLPIIKKSKTGPSTDEEVLRALADKHDLPRLLLEYRQLTKLKNTYIDALPKLVDSGSRIHASFNQAGTETGRLSSSNPNLQNIPVKTDIGREIRRAVIAFDKNSFLLSADYSQIELRILAHLSKDENLISAFNKNEDIHKVTASLIYGVKESDVSEQMRQTAKRINFGIIYGLSSFGLARDLDIGLQEAQSFIDAYFLRYPKVKDYMQEQIEKAKKQGFVTTILGRRRYIPEIKDKNQQIRQFAERKAINTPVQGSASDLIKLAMIEIHDQVKKNKLRSRLILQIHDELVFNVDKTEGESFTELVCHKMENVLALDVPVVVDVKKGDNWLEMHEARGSTT